MSRTHKDTKKWRNKIADQFGWPVSCVGGISPTFKKLRRRNRKAKERAALRSNREVPLFRKCDAWDWY